MKQYIWKPIVVGCLDIQEVVRLVPHQQIDQFLKLAHDYNEDPIHVFYFRLHDRRGSSFKFSIGNTVYEFTNDLWKSLFGITIVDVDDDVEAELLVMDTNLHQDFKWNIHLNQLLRTPHPDDYFWYVN